MAAPTTTCEFTLKKGSRRGELCGKAGHHTGADGKCYCTRHYKPPSPVIVREPRPVIAPDVLCEFRCPLDLSPTLALEIVTTPEEQRRLEVHRGYLNYKIVGPPVFIEGDYLPMVYMSHYDNETHITKAKFIEHLRDAIDYLNSRPDVYNTLGYSTSEMTLETITYERRTGLFIANLSLLTGI